MTLTLGAYFRESGEFDPLEIDQMVIQADQYIRVALADLRHIRLRDKLDQARMDAAIRRLESLL